MTLDKLFNLSAVCLGGVLLAGCVMTEKYEAEKGRALNFQRLLAQEEKRTGELDSELKRVKREAGELEARNREVTAQLQAVREQMARIQEETDALREAAALRERETLGRPHSAASKARRAEPAVPKVEKAQDGAPIYHEVKPGETLFRLARQYGADVGSIKKWNSLQDDLIEVGQRLIVGHQ